MNSFGGKMHNKKIKYFTATGVIIIFGVLYGLFWHRNNQKERYPFDEMKETIQTAEMTEETEETVALGQEQWIYVYVCGSVKMPGVYSLREGARMYEALELAGGLTEEGCADYLELALPVGDGERIYVPSVEEAASNSQLIQSSQKEAEYNGRININTASREQLMTLPGIGEAKADAILAYRRENGNFSVIEDIMKIPGIKEAAFAKIKDYICVSF